MNNSEDYQSNKFLLIINFSMVVIVLLSSCTRPISLNDDQNEALSEQPLAEVSPGSPSVPSPTQNEISAFEGDCVFCFLDTEDPRAPTWDETVKGHTYNAQDQREIIEIDENFSVPSGEVVEFNEKIILVKSTSRNNIEIYGTLKVVNSVMIWHQTEYQQCRLVVKDGGVLDIKDSYAFWGNQYWVNWDYEDGATVRLDHFVGNPWSVMSGSVDFSATNYSTVKLTILNNVKDATVTISNAHHIWMEVYPAEGSYSLTFPEKRTWDDWQLNLWPETDVSISDSYIYETDIGLSNNTHVTVEDTPHGFSLGWAVFNDEPEFITCEFHDLGIPYKNEGQLYENKTWDLPCNNSSLTVINSRLERTWPVTWGQVHLKIYNSNLVDPRVFNGPATMEVYDSSIDIIAAYGEGIVYVENSQIKDAIEVKDAGTKIYTFNTSGYPRTLESDGGEHIRLEEAGLPWE